MAGTDKRKQSLYFPEDMLREIQEEANRQDHSLSWIVQQCWKMQPPVLHSLSLLQAAPRPFVKPPVRHFRFRRCDQWKITGEREQTRFADQTIFYRTRNNCPFGLPAISRLSPKSAPKTG